MNIYTLAALWMMLSLHKGERGRYEVRFAKRCDDILEALTSWPSRGMIPLRELRSVTGKLSWIAGIIPRLRWAEAIFYAVVADGENDLREGKEADRATTCDKYRREKPHLIAVKRLGSSLA